MKPRHIRETAVPELKRHAREALLLAFRAELAANTSTATPRKTTGRKRKEQS